MNPESIYARLEQAFPSWLVAHDFAAIDPWIEVKAEGLLELGRYLRQEPDLKFDVLHCITAVDYFEPDAEESGTGPMAAALGADLSPFEHRASSSAGVEGVRAAVAGR